MSKRANEPAMRTVKQFADAAGVRVVECGPGWGGRYGYVTADAPNCMECGFKTRAEAREAWMADTFGERAAAALRALLAELERTP